MEQAYEYVTRDFGRLLGREWLQRIDTELWKFTERLNQWLHALFLHPTPAWREHLDAFLEEQAAAGFTVTPESRQELVAFLEGWASNLPQAKPKPTPKPQVELLASRLAAKAPAEGYHRPAHANPQVTHPQVKPPQYGRIVRSHWHVFHDKLKEADGYLDAIERLLDPLGRKVIAAKPDEPVEVETDVDEIVALIYRHNEAMEQARQAWLDGKLGGDTHTHLVNALSPSSLGLPLFTDEAQAKRAQVQWKEIGKRLKEKISFFDKLIFAMEVTEKVGDVASLALGAGLIVSAVKQGGKIALVKAAKIAAQAAVAEGVALAKDAAGQAIEDALLAAGVSQETISAIQTAATVVEWVLELKRTRASLRSGSASVGSTQSAASTPLPSQEPLPLPKAPKPPPRGQFKNQSGDPEIAAHKARTQPYGSQAPRPPKRKSHPAIEGRVDKPRTPHHTFLQRTIADEMQATGEYARVTMRMKLSKVSGIQHNPDIEPDNIGVHLDGRIDIIEILSPSQTREELEDKLRHALNELPPHLRGGTRVIDPQDAFE